LQIKIERNKSNSLTNENFSIRLKLKESNSIKINDNRAQIEKIDSEEGFRVDVISCENLCEKNFPKSAKMRKNRKRSSK
jgi:cupin superfamily acireductone dioxygenase involved in methionine salvage